MMLKININIIECTHIHWCIHITADTLVPGSGGYIGEGRWIAAPQTVP